MTMGIRYNLDLDMACRRYRLLHIDGAVAKSSERLTLCQSQRRLQVLAFMNKADTLAATSGRRLEQYWVANLVRDLGRLGSVF